MLSSSSAGRGELDIVVSVNAFILALDPLISDCSHLSAQGLPVRHFRRFACVVRARLCGREDSRITRCGFRRL